MAEKDIKKELEQEEIQEITLEELEQELDDMPKEDQKKVFKSWKDLKWWQKALVLTGGATLLVVGGVVIFKLKKDSKAHAIEGEKILKTLEDVQPTKVVVPMDMNNATDAAVQDLVNALAATSEDVVEAAAI